MLTKEEQLLLQHLAQYVTDHKKQCIDKVLGNRTRQLTVVLEDIYQSQNASAVIRTCEGMGVQDVHIIENYSRYQINRRVLKGADKWVTINRFRARDENNTDRCFSYLRERGYKILVMDPSPDAIPIYSINVTGQKCALVFGNELKGLSESAITGGDQVVRLPMYGFTESYNISVSVAVCLTTLMSQLRTADVNIGLTNDEKEMIKLLWFRKIVRRSDVVEREFMRTIQ